MTHSFNIIDGAVKSIRNALDYGAHLKKDEAVLIAYNGHDAAVPVSYLVVSKQNIDDNVVRLSHLTDGFYKDTAADAYGAVTVLAQLVLSGAVLVWDGQHVAVAIRRTAQNAYALYSRLEFVVGYCVGNGTIAKDVLSYELFLTYANAELKNAADTIGFWIEDETILWVDRVAVYTGQNAKRKALQDAKRLKEKAVYRFSSRRRLTQVHPLVAYCIVLFEGGATIDNEGLWVGAEGETITVTPDPTPGDPFDEIKRSEVVAMTVTPENPRRFALDSLRDAVHQKPPYAVWVWTEQPQNAYSQPYRLFIHTTTTVDTDALVQSGYRVLDAEQVDQLDFLYDGQYVAFDGKLYLKHDKRETF